MKGLAWLLIALVGLHAVADEEMDPADTSSAEAARALAEMQAAHIAVEAGYTTPQTLSGAIMLDVAGYATVTGRSIEEVRAMFGYSTYEIVGEAECDVDAKGHTLAKSILVSESDTDG